MWAWRAGWDGQTVTVRLGMAASLYSDLGREARRAWMGPAESSPFDLTGCWADGSTTEGHVGSGSGCWDRGLAESDNDFEMPGLEGRPPESIRVNLLDRVECELACFASPSQHGGSETAGLVRRVLPAMDRAIYLPDEGIRIWLWRAGWDGRELAFEIGVLFPPETGVWEDLRSAWLTDFEFPWEISGQSVDGSGLIVDAGSSHTMWSDEDNAIVGLVGDVRIKGADGTPPSLIRVSYLGAALWEIPTGIEPPT